MELIYFEFWIYFEEHVVLYHIDIYILMFWYVNYISMCLNNIITCQMSLSNNGQLGCLVSSLFSIADPLWKESTGDHLWRNQ